MQDLIDLDMVGVSSYILVMCFLTTLILNVLLCLVGFSFKFCVCLMYRSPSFQGVLDGLLSTLSNLPVSLLSNVFLVEDFKIDVSNSNHPLCSQVFSITSSFLLYQFVKDFTHFDPSRDHSIIDLFLYHPLLT